MAEAVKFQIKRGPSERLQDADKVKGCWYLTTDTHELYVCQDGETLDPMTSGGVKTYNHINQLPRSGNENIVYFIVDDSGTAIYRYVKNEGYKKVLDTTLTIKVVRGGNSSTDPDNEYVNN